jgi:hypothetical protein
MNLAEYRAIKYTGVIVSMAIIILIALSPQSSAAVFVYGSEYNYSEVVLPNNSYVHQGENISQGNYYDLNGVYGFSGIIGNWEKDNGMGIYAPDHLVTLDGNLRKPTYIDPEKFPVGRWYQWDGVTCKESDYCTSSFGHGNNYIFSVVKGTAEASSSKSPSNVTHYSETIVIFDGNITQTISVDRTGPVTPAPEESVNQGIPVHTIQLPDTQSTPEETIDDTVYVTMEAETINPAIKEVTPRSNPFWFLALAAFLVVIVFRRN